MASLIRDEELQALERSAREQQRLAAQVACVPSLSSLLAALDTAAAMYDWAVKTRYPVGHTIAWRYSANVPRCEGFVVDHGGLMKIRVKNGASGFEYWIDARQVLDGAVNNTPTVAAS